MIFWNFDFVHARDIWKTFLKSVSWTVLKNLSGCCTEPFNPNNNCAADGPTTCVVRTQSTLMDFRFTDRYRPARCRVTVAGGLLGRRKRLVSVPVRFHGLLSGFTYDGCPVDWSNAPGTPSKHVARSTGFPLRGSPQSEPERRRPLLAPSVPGLQSTGVTKNRPDISNETILRNAIYHRQAARA